MNFYLANLRDWATISVSIVRIHPAGPSHPKLVRRAPRLHQPRRPQPVAQTRCGFDFGSFDLQNDDLIPPNALPCPHCGFWCMIPWSEWWECPRCDDTRLPG